MCSLTEVCASWSLQGKDTHFHPLACDLWLMTLFWPLPLFLTTTSLIHQDHITASMFLSLFTPQLIRSTAAHPSLQTPASCCSFPLCVLLPLESGGHSRLFLCPPTSLCFTYCAYMCVCLCMCVTAAGWSGILLHNWNAPQMKKTGKNIWIQPVEQLDRI